MFEKHYKEDPPRESIQSIEKSPEDYYPIHETTPTVSIKERDEKSTSKAPKRKPKKNHPKLHKAAVESVQA